MPPRPGGVAMATMVSSVENMPSTQAMPCTRYQATRLAEMITVFMNASPMLSELTVGSSAIARCTMRRSYGLSGPISCGAPRRSRLLRDELRHLLQLGVLVRAEAVAVDDDAVVVAELSAERGGDDVLQRLQAFAAAADQHAAVLAFEIDARRLRRLFDRRRQRHAHGVDDALHERGDLLVRSRSRCVSFVHASVGRF